MESSFPWAVFPILFVGTSVVVLMGLSSIGGWRALADAYPAESSPLGKKLWFQSARFGLVSYGACINVVVEDAGLYLSVFLPFRLFHHPIRVPWGDIRVEQTKHWLASIGTLTFVREPNVTLRLHWRLVERIDEASAGRLRVAK